jgi:hypothetical protein
MLPLRELESQLAIRTRSESLLSQKSPQAMTAFIEGLVQIADIIIEQMMRK